MVSIEAFRLNPAAQLQEIALGEAGTPLLIADDIFVDPAAVVAAATKATLSPAPHPNDFYPGARYPLPDAFHPAFADWLTSLVPGRAFASERNGFVSVVATPAAELLPIQTLPHFDTTDEAIFAAVIYLFEDGFGGTSFYRHRSTGIEMLSRSNEALYRAALRREVADPASLPRRYHTGDNALFERIHRQEPAFNRMSLYPGRLLHSGDIAPDFAGGQNARLTITALCRLK